MTFDEILNSTSARIEYLGGLAAVAPFIPFPIDVIKEKLRNDPSLLQPEDDVAWKSAAGFSVNPENGRIYDDKENPIWDLYEKKKITSISCVDSRNILREAARQIAVLPQDEIDKICPNQPKLYYVSIAVDGRVSIPILAKDPKDAREKAIYAFSNANIGDVECVDFKPVNAEDIHGNITDY